MRSYERLFQWSFRQVLPIHSKSITLLAIIHTSTVLDEALTLKFTNELYRNKEISFKHTNP